jgi:RND family efflux transporter MFP subunit
VTLERIVDFFCSFYRLKNANSRIIYNKQISHKNKMKSIFHVALILASILAACSPKEKSDEVVPATNVNSTVVVQTQTIKPFNGSINLKYSGLVEAENALPLSFSTSGTVQKVLVNEGDRITKGQLLAQLDKSNAENMYTLANAKYKQATDAMARLKPMYENGTATEIQWVEVNTGVEQTLAAKNMAEKTVKDCDLYAHSAGTIGNKNIQEGMNVVALFTAFDVLNIEQVEVVASVPENEISSIKIGDTALVYVGAIGRNYTGVVKEVGVSANQLSHSYPVRIELANEKQLIKPGMVCTVQIATTSENKNGFLVSNKSILAGMNDQYVYVAENGMAVRKPISVIKMTENGVVVSGDFKADSKIIVAGQHKLQQGSNIQVTK